MKNRFVTLLVALALILTLSVGFAACGQAGNTSESTSSSSSGSTSSPSSGENSSSGEKHVHSLTLIPAKEKGYATHGNREYYSCTSCGSLFLDGAAEVPTTLASVIIPSETGFEKKQFTEDDYVLNYCEYKPLDVENGNEKVPLILFLHGAGERGSNNEWQLKNAILQVNKSGEWKKSVIIAPQCPSSTGGNTNSDVNDPNKWVETPWTNGNYTLANVPESKPAAYTAKLIENYSELEYVDSDRVYVIGLSMGGFGTWDMLARHSDLFAAGVPICGGGATDAVDVLKNVPVYAFHGTKDGAVPYLATSGMVEAIKNAGGTKILFKSFEGAGHGIWNDAITFRGDADYPAVETWLFSQRKSDRK